MAGLLVTILGGCRVDRALRKSRIEQEKVFLFYEVFMCDGLTSYGNHKIYVVNEADENYYRKWLIVLVGSALFLTSYLLFISIIYK